MVEISQDLYNKLIQKKFYKFICGSALLDCFKDRYIIDVHILKNVLNKFQIFRYSVDNIDLDIFNSFHILIHDNSENYLKLVKPTVQNNKTLWLGSGQSINDILSDDSIIESNVQWNVTSNN